MNTGLYVISDYRPYQHAAERSLSLTPVKEVRMLVINNGGLL